MTRFILAAAMLASTAAQAAEIACPSALGGRPLLRVDGASVYLGDVSHGMDLAPDRQARDLRGVNVWNVSTITPSRYVTLVCRYEGGAQWTARLPEGVRSCTQNLATPSMVCGG